MEATIEHLAGRLGFPQAELDAQELLLSNISDGDPTSLGTLTGRL
jgi:hypothetical protein